MSFIIVPYTSFFFIKIQIHTVLFFFLNIRVFHYKSWFHNTVMEDFHTFCQPCNALRLKDENSRDSKQLFFLCLHQLVVSHENYSNVKLNASSLLLKSETILSSNCILSIPGVVGRMWKRVYLPLPPPPHTPEGMGWGRARNTRARTLGIRRDIVFIRIVLAFLQTSYSFVWPSGNKIFLFL